MTLKASAWFTSIVAKMLSREKSEIKECQCWKVMFMGKPTSVNRVAGTLYQSRHSTELAGGVVE